MLKVAPWTKLNIVFKPVLRLKALSKLKSSIKTLCYNSAHGTFEQPRLI